jgi:hypothetical protein
MTGRALCFSPILQYTGIPSTTPAAFHPFQPLVMATWYSCFVSAYALYRISHFFSVLGSFRAYRLRICPGCSCHCDPSPSLNEVEACIPALSGRALPLLADDTPKNQVCFTSSMQAFSKFFIRLLLEPTAQCFGFISSQMRTVTPLLQSDQKQRVCRESGWGNVACLRSHSHGIQHSRPYITHSFQLNKRFRSLSPASLLPVHSLRNFRHSVEEQMRSEAVHVRQHILQLMPEHGVQPARMAEKISRTAV